MGGKAGLLYCQGTVRKVRTQYLPKDYQLLYSREEPISSKVNPSSLLCQADYSGISLRALSLKEMPSGECVPVCAYAWVCLWVVGVQGKAKKFFSPPKANSSVEMWS